jgi:hypothetical protein
MKSECFKEIPINNWNTFKNYISDLDGRWAYRGQRCVEWGLESSLERSFRKMDPSVFEMQIIEKFQQRAYHYLSEAMKPDDIVEWLSLMQHHGAPTRLLDFTFSPYIAAYFALERCDNECAIWAIDYNWIRFETVSKLTKSGITDYQIGGGHVTDTWFSKLNFYDLIFNHKEKLIIPVVPRKLNERQTIQQGLFLFGSNRQHTFEENIEAYEKLDIRKHLYKFVLSKSYRNEALCDLNLMNVSRASLFPGLDGFAQSIALETDLLVEQIHR